MFAVVWFVTFFVRSSASAERFNTALYGDIVNANCSDSLFKVKDAPIKVYEFIHDSVEGRKHIGVIGSDIERIFPESLDVIPTYTIPGRAKGQPAIHVQYFPMIDKNVLFMHSFAALKELIDMYDSFEILLGDIKNSGSDQSAVFVEIERRLSREANNQVIEEDKLVRAEAHMLQEELLLLSQRRSDGEKKILKEMEDEKKILAYQEELLNIRISREEKFQEKLLQDSIQFERELTFEREHLRRETEEKLLHQKIEFDVGFEAKKVELHQENIRTEIRTKTELERENEDITLRKMNLQALLDTKRFIDSVQVLYSQGSIMLADLIARPSELLLVMGFLAAAVICIYAISEISAFLRNYMQSRLGRPMLVRETSYSWSFLTAVGIKLNHKPQEDKEHVEGKFGDVILPDKDRKRIVELALATRNTKRVGATYRHVLLHGPPGTGKTMIARKLAESSGMDYAIMSGGDVGPLGEDAVNQLHTLFKWASRSQNGLLLFIDETEAFLGSRERLTGAENAHVRHALNALLYQTGTHSKKFMLVLATNRPEELDTAVLDRLDVSIVVGLPLLDQRTDMLKLYLNMLKSSVRVFSSRKAAAIEIDEECTEEAYVKSIAARMDGFSGREISKFVISLHHTVSLMDDKRINRRIIESVLIQKVDEHSQKNCMCVSN